MPERQDRRVRRTRAALRAALMSLMVEKGYDAVTVQDLIDRADVGRSTFYAHYSDKADLLDDMLVQLRGLLEPPAGAASGGSGRTLRFSLEMFRHVRDQRPLMRAMLGRPGAAPVVERIELMLTDIVRSELDPPAATSPPRVPLDLVSASVVSAFLAALTWWVEGDFRQTPEEMDHLFQVLVAPGVRSAVGLT
jgi:AcrR family transcriptional regulator